VNTKPYVCVYITERFNPDTERLDVKCKVLFGEGTSEDEMRGRLTRQFEAEYPPNDGWVLKKNDATEIPQQFIDKFATHEPRAKGAPMPSMRGISCT